MDQNKQTIQRFYAAFSALDAEAMVACYSADIQFYDPVFGLLESREMVGAMWTMLCGRATGWSLGVEAVEDLGDGYYTCEWEARYLFGPKRRLVTNRVKAHMRVQGGVILEHSDAFSVHRWSAQAYGWIGWLFGWMGWWQRKVQNQARAMLFHHLERG